MGDSSDDDDHPRRRWDRPPTPVRGVEVLDAEMVHLSMHVDNHDHRLRKLEQWRAALSGVPGQAGAIEQISEENEEMRQTLNNHGARISGVEHITFKIIAVAGACSLVGGALAALVFKLLG